MSPPAPTTGTAESRESKKSCLSGCFGKLNGDPATEGPRRVDSSRVGAGLVAPSHSNGSFSDFFGNRDPDSTMLDRPEPLALELVSLAKHATTADPSRVTGSPPARSKRDTFGTAKLPSTTRQRSKHSSGPSRLEVRSDGTRESPTLPDLPKLDFPTRK